LFELRDFWLSCADDENIFLLLFDADELVWVAWLEIFKKAE
jgi:hypothetical protein